MALKIGQLKEGRRQKVERHIEALGDSVILVPMSRNRIMEIYESTEPPDYPELKELPPEPTMVIDTTADNDGGAGYRQKYAQWLVESQEVGAENHRLVSEWTNVAKDLSNERVELMLVESLTDDDGAETTREDARFILGINDNLAAEQLVNAILQINGYDPEKKN